MGRFCDLHVNDDLAKFVLLDMKLNKEDIDAIGNYFTETPVKRAYVFGSFARNEADADSDVDILVELDHSQPIGLRFFTFQNDLAVLLKKGVDLVTEEGLSKYVRPYIEHDKILIYEKSARG